MSPYERRRGGNAPPGGLRGRPGAGNARSGQRGSGHSVATTVGRQPDTELGSAGPASWRRGVANSTASGRRVRQHRSFAPWGKARPEKWRAEPRPEPDSGNPTVRDRRGASGNVASWSMISTRRARLISISTDARNRVEKAVKRTDQRVPARLPAPARFSPRAGLAASVAATPYTAGVSQGSSRSAAINAPTATIHVRLITPSANRAAISPMQQPMQDAPCRTPPRRPLPAPGRASPAWLSGVRHRCRHRALAAVSW